ncbi:MAG: rubrerythrin family protein [Chlorobium sp.]|nr:rubrerythrin family protein [Chlorobium sp.]MCW8818892.1 hypothetical protein [Ignavibacteriaceae bacterium]
MNNSLSELLEISITHELNISRLYTMFHDLFEEDEDFWWQLSIEERSHAALLRDQQSSCHTERAVPENLLASSIHDLKTSNSTLESLINEYAKNPPAREEALQTAYNLEQSVGEIHYQEFMTRKTCSLSDEMFKQLNMEDKDHADRIKSYMLAHGITPEEPYL